MAAQTIYIKKTKIPVHEQTIDFILNSPTERLATLKVSTIAAHLGVNRCYLSHKFKTKTRIRLSFFLERTKIYRSCLLLSKFPGLTIESVAELLGFCSVDYFRRIFKKHIATTPGKFRRYSNGLFL